MSFDDMLVIGSTQGGRYKLERKLGEGSSGSVYLVRDHETGEQLALKRLHRADERSIARLKREFRTLADIHHPNLVRLYALGRDQDSWFLSLEYVAGQDLLRHLDVRVRDTAQLGRAPVRTPEVQLERTIVAFQQLARGVRALHDAHVLHRDLKPSNVLVERERVVVLDFGLALDLGDEAATVTMDGVPAGTPAYMAPEQVHGSASCPSNDWYALGVMLYEALSGSLPFDGQVQELLRRKLASDPVPVEKRVAGIPDALARLCNGLLRREPERRPTGSEVLAVLDALAPAPTRPSTPPSLEWSELSGARQRLTAPIVGRDAERAQLQRAFAAAERGEFAVVHVCGPSGAGKSALVEQFLNELEQHGAVSSELAPVVLRGRCYERETMPFKALDAAMDALVTRLGRMPDLEVSHALPRTVSALTQLFPALERLSAVQKLLRSEQRLTAAMHAREQAELALRELFARVASRRVLVLFIDDLQWGDLDSARILRGWIEPPGLAGVLLVLSYRNDELASSPCLRLLFGDGMGLAPRAEQVLLGPLSDELIRALCRQRFHTSTATPSLIEEIVEHIVIEAQGSPYLAAQLATLALSELRELRPEPLEILTIDALMSRRTALLSPFARRLLNLLATAGRPVSAKLALQLTAATGPARAALHELSSLGLVRSRHSDGDNQLAVYHDRLREAVLRGLTQTERASLDGELLHALENAGVRDPAWLHALASSAGERDAALRYGRAAADLALQTLAFERAAELYRVCLQLSAAQGDDVGELWQKLGLALGHSGRGQQAAQAYLEAAARSEGEHALQLERRAASHLLRSGRFEEGETLIDKVLAELGLSTPKTSAGLIAAIAWERTRLSMRGPTFTPRRLQDAPFELHYGAELCGTLSLELQPYDPLRAKLLQARSLRMALATGVPELVARALCVAATMAAVGGGPDAAREAEVLLQRANELQERFPSALLRGHICSARAICAMLEARMRDVLHHSEEAERIFRSASTGDEGEYYYRYTLLASRITALLQLGHHERAHAELARVVNEARSTENIAAMLALSSVQTRAELSVGLGARAAQRLEGERGQLPKHRFGLLHVFYITSLLRVGCATGQHDWALAQLKDDYERYQGSILRRGGPFAVILPALHARLLLNRAVARGQSAADAKALVSSDLRALRRFRKTAADAARTRTRARLHLLAGDRVSARELLRLSVAGFKKDNLTDEAARDRYAYGLLLGGAEGAQLQAAALETLRGLGFVEPLRELAGYYPELLTAP